MSEIRYTSDLFNINEAERDLIIEWGDYTSVCADEWTNADKALLARFTKWKEDRDAIREKAAPKETTDG